MPAVVPNGWISSLVRWLSDGCGALRWREGPQMRFAQCNRVPKHLQNRVIVIFWRREPSAGRRPRLRMIV